MEGYMSEYEDDELDEMEDDEFEGVDEETIEKLLPVYAEIAENMIEQFDPSFDTEKMRKLSMASTKAMVKAAFMSNNLASEKDFTRLWPRILDEMLVEHARNVHYAVTPRLRVHMDEMLDLGADEIFGKDGDDEN